VEKLFLFVEINNRRRAMEKDELVASVRSCLLGEYGRLTGIFECKKQERMSSSGFIKLLPVPLSMFFSARINQIDNEIDVLGQKIQECIRAQLALDRGEYNPAICFLDKMILAFKSWLPPTVFFPWQSVPGIMQHYLLIQALLDELISLRMNLILLEATKERSATS